MTQKPKRPPRRPPKPVQMLPPLDERQRYTYDEAAVYLRCSRRHLLRRISTGDVETFPDGHRRYIHGAELVRLSTPPPKPVSDS